VLSLGRVKKVLAEFEKEPTKRDFSLLHRLLGRLKFFYKFPEPIQRKLIENASLRQYAEGEIIFSQGEASEDFFVIVRGSVQVRQKHDEFGKEEVILRSCYDGEHFGEMIHFKESETMSKEKVAEMNKQRTTCIVRHSNLRWIGDGTIDCA